MKISPEAAAILGSPILVLDGGARNGPTDVQSIADLSSCYCFEPNPKELDSIKGIDMARKKPTADYGQIISIPQALGRETGEMKLNISARVGATSCLQPNVELLKTFSRDHWSQMQTITKTVEVNGVSLQDFSDHYGIKSLDFLKLDTQGSEYDILQGAGSLINGVSIAKVEVEFLPLYKGQRLAHEVMAYFHEQGFEVIDLEHVNPCRRFHVDPHLPPESYRLVWADLVVMNPVAVAKRPLHACLVMSALGYHDVALHLLEKHLAHDAPAQELFRLRMQSHYSLSGLNSKIKQFVLRKWGISFARTERTKQVRSVLGA